MELKETAMARRNIKYGADVIKFAATGGVFSGNDNPRLESYSLEEMRAIVGTAHSLGRKVAVHAHGSTGIKDAIVAGADSIEHGSFIDDEGIRLLKEHGTYLVPTLYVSDWFPEHAASTGANANTIRKAKEVMGVAHANLERALRQGVKVAFGTDAGTVPHGENAREFQSMVRSGMTPLESIQAATTNAADLLGMSDRIGAISPGMFADLICVTGDPLQDVAVLQHVRFVMKEGFVERLE
jgi:imidazolonepropionase-like amidohydrolase